MKRRKKQEPPIGGLDKLHSKKLNLRRAEPSRLLDVNGAEPSRHGILEEEIEPGRVLGNFQSKHDVLADGSSWLWDPSYVRRLSALSRKEKKTYCRWNRLSLRTDNPRFRATCLSTKRLLFTQKVRQNSERNTLNASRTYPCMHRTLNTSE